MTRKLKSVVGVLVHEDQSGFMLTHSIYKNISQLLAVLQYLHNLNSQEWDTSEEGYASYGLL